MNITDLRNRQDLAICLAAVALVVSMVSVAPCIRRGVDWNDRAASLLNVSANK